MTDDSLAPKRRLVCVVTGCFNEEDNVRPLAERIREQFAAFPDLDFEHLFIDNRSTDRTRTILRQLAAEDQRIKVIFNSRNFGHIRSPMHGMREASGDAVIAMASDFQDPPELIPRMLEKWNDGFKIVKCVKTASHENALMFLLRKLFYATINRLSEVELTQNFTGTGLYDRSVIDVMRRIDDPYPYFRGLISEIGFDQAVIEFTQPRRSRGITKNNFYTLYDMAMLGLINHSKVPLRLATFAGVFMAFVSLAAGLAYLVMKLVYWDRFVAGVAPVAIGMFFLGSVQLVFLGILGEYIGAIFTQVQHRPLVIEQERLNFPAAPGTNTGACAPTPGRAGNQRGACAPTLPLVATPLADEVVDE